LKRLLATIQITAKYLPRQTIIAARKKANPFFGEDGWFGPSELALGKKMGVLTVELG
jgi:hypothetical protein